MSCAERSYAAIIVGGGPAGATAAATLAARGRAVLLLERERFPRFHIGESLLPLANDVLAELGLVEEMRDAGFVEKRGATFETEDGILRARIDFATAPGVCQPRTWQVARSEFDHVLLQRARAAGAEVIEGARVTDFTVGLEGTR